jgi:hypothetical protein
MTDGLVLIAENLCFHCIMVRKEEAIQKGGRSRLDDSGLF